MGSVRKNDICVHQKDKNNRKQPNQNSLRLCAAIRDQAGQCVQRQSPPSSETNTTLHVGSWDTVLRRCPRKTCRSASTPRCCWLQSTTDTQCFLSFQSVRQHRKATRTYVSAGSGEVEDHDSSASAHWTEVPADKKPWSTHRGSSNRVDPSSPRKYCLLSRTVQGCICFWCPLAQNETGCV